MSAFYVAWSYVPNSQTQAAPFDYLVHPGTGDGGVIYCNAILEAGDKKAAWSRVLMDFPGARRDLMALATNDYVTQYDRTKRMAGVKTVKTKTHQ